MKLKEFEHKIDGCYYDGTQWVLVILDANFRRTFVNRPPYKRGDIVNYQMFLNFVDTLK